jgi:uncharacterized protein with GYD domain
MTFYSEMAAEAKALLAEFGQSITIVTTTQGTYDVNTGTTSDSTVTQTGLKAVITKYKTGEIDGTKIQQGDCKVIVESAATPTVNSTVTAGSITYTVIDFEQIAPSGETVIWKLQVRK